jgi:MFS family permease
MSSPDILLPDPRLRRAVLAVLLGAVLLGVLVIGWGLPWLSQTLLTARANGTLTFPLACWLFLAFTAVLAAPVIWFGAWAIRFGRRVIASGQYPPPGTRVIVTTHVLRGPITRVAARGQQVLGLGLILCGMALLVLAGWGVVIMTR